MDNKSENAMKKDLIASFQATGVAPLDPERGLKKILNEDIGNAPSRSVIASIDEYSSDSDVDEPLTIDNSDGDLLEDASDDVGAEIEYVLPQNKKVTAGQFVLFKVRVNEEGQEEIDLLGMKSLDNTKKILWSRTVTSLRQILLIF
nr:unnamed protein product [Callosobruchus analis]